MCSKRDASRAASQEQITSVDSSSGGQDQFIILPHPKRAVRKMRARASSSQADMKLLISPKAGLSEKQGRVA
jgi:hypothetical protein